MRTQNFGIEIEMTGLTRCAAAKIIAGHFGSEAVHVGGGYDAYAVRDERNRQWKVMSDASIRCQNRRGETASTLYSVEVVSPICQYRDIETIQELIRKLRTGGAKVNKSCGIHVHVDASNYTPQTLRNLVNIMAAKEDLLYKTLQVDVAREDYCKKADTQFLDVLNRKRPKTMQDLETLWYNGSSGRYRHYDHTCFPKARLNSGCLIPRSTRGKSKHISSFALPSAIRRLCRKVRPVPERTATMKNIPSAPGFCASVLSAMNLKRRGCTF